MMMHRRFAFGTEFAAQRSDHSFVATASCIAIEGVFRKTAMAVLCLGACLMSGCGGGGAEGPVRYNLTGTVSFDGKLVPAGNIQFMPDTVKGNQGPAGYATIKDGKYSTSETGRGAVGGPHIVIITGLKRPPAAEPQPFVEGGESNSLFPEYQTSVDLPKSDSEQDFSITAPAP